MRGLEEDIDLLVELDDWRVKAARWRDEGKSALATSYEPENEEYWQKTETAVLEHSHVLRALLAHRRNVPFRLEKKLSEELAQLDSQQIFERLADDIPVLRSARAMNALVAAPDAAFSRAVMLMYYQIVREIYSSNAPDWIIGGARAGSGLSPTAFVTGECIRAILAFRWALDHTATYLSGIAQMLQRRSERATGGVPEQWRTVDDRRMVLDFLTTIEREKGNIALALPEVIDRESTALSSVTIDARVGIIIDKLKLEIDRCVREFTEAREEIDRRWKIEAAGDARKAIRAQSAHGIAFEAVDNAVKRAEQAQSLLKNGCGVAELTTLAKMFAKAAVDTAKIVHPATGYVSRVLDRELAAAGGASTATWDPAEMAFAAVSYGAATGRWNDERLRRAGIHLTKSISERGRFPIGRPIHATSRGYNLFVLNAEVLRSFAQLLQRTEGVPLEAEVVRSMIAFFEETRIGREGRWHHEEVRGDEVARRWVTAAAVVALDRINRMLDQRINAIIFRHFSTKRPDADEITTPELPKLFYGDYGLATADPATGVQRDDSVAVILERMRAHVAGVHRTHFGSPVFSLVLHGPPGTGKTTLVEALARSARVRLVEVTPSDIVVGGADAIERRARAVFKALSLLTHAVVMFDEFDPVLQKRDPDDRSATVFSFLTPGMLPKLKTLHDMAAKRSVAYVLITNLISKLDEAAIRDGRFDVRLGIYPPDVLSRTGRLHSVLLEYERTMAEKHAPLVRIPGRVEEVIRATAGAPMNTIGRPGWLTAPSGPPDGRGNAFNYIYGRADKLPKIRLEAKLRMYGHGPAAVQEFREWAWVTLGEDTLANGGNPIATPPTSQKVDERLHAETEKRESALRRIKKAFEDVLHGHPDDE